MEFLTRDESEVDLNRKLADMYFYEYKYFLAHENYVKVLERCVRTGDNNQIPFLYNRLGACKYADMDYAVALDYFDKANIYGVLFNDETAEINALFNCALTYRRMGWFDKCIEYADLCILKLKKETNSDKYLYAHTIKITCYDELGEYNKAFEANKKLIDEIQDKKGVVAAQLYNNMGTAYLEREQYELSLEYFNWSEKIRREKEPNRLSHTIIDKSQIFIKQHLYSRAEEELLIGIELALKFNDYDYVLRGYYYLLSVYEVLAHNDKIGEIYMRIMQQLKERNSKELGKLYLDIAKFYIGLGKLDKADEFMKLAQEEN